MTLAELVAQQHDALIERFVDRARQSPQADGLDRVELADSMTFFLDDLVEALATGKGVAATESAAASHGIERLGLGFRIDRVIREYAIIGEIVLESATAAGVVPTPLELNVLISTIGDGAAIAATEYVRRREAELTAREAAHAGFLAHELRNSLASARFAFDLLRARVGGGEQASLVNIVDGAMRQANQHLDDALAGARMRGGVVSRVRVYVGLLLNEIAAELRPQADARGIDIVVDASNDLTAQADPRLLRSAVTNLVHNGIKFSVKGGTLRINAVHRAGWVHVTVDDACGGIPSDKVDRIFAPFVQGDANGRGFGLGLAIARDAAEAQGGQVSVENLPPVGCRFTLTIPIHVT